MLCQYLRRIQESPVEAICVFGDVDTFEPSYPIRLPDAQSRVIVTSVIGCDVRPGSKEIKAAGSG